MNKYKTKAAVEKLLGVTVEQNGNSFSYKGSLYLRGTQITALPENLNVGGSLYLRGTQITALPENLNVGGYLDLEGTQITALPENLNVGGSLYLRGTQITALPENLNVGGYLVSEPIGSRKDRTSYHISKDVVHCGCFKGTLNEFEAEVNCTHPYGVFREEYDSFIKDAKYWKSNFDNK